MSYNKQIDNPALYDTTSLIEKLHQLFNKIEVIVNHHKEKGLIDTIPYQHVPTRNIDFQSNCYTPDYSNIHYYDYYEFTAGQFAECRELIESLQEYKDAAIEVSRTFKLTHTANDIGLSMFVREMIKAIPNNQINSTNIKSWINFFIDSFKIEVGDKIINWTVELWLDNIDINCDELEIMEGIFLRRPGKEHFDLYEPRKLYIDESDKVFSRVMNSTVILEFSLLLPPENFKPFPTAIYAQADCLLNILRLYKPCSTSVLFQVITPKSIFHHQTSESINKGKDWYHRSKLDYSDLAKYRFSFLQQEKDDIMSFSKKMYPILKEHSIEGYFKGKAYDLALHRYNDALLNSDMKPYQIVSSMSALEAILSDGNTEITFKIRLRVATLLQSLGFNAIEVFQHMNDAYSLRSKVVHGAIIKDGSNSLIEFAKKHTLDIVNYTRLCLIISLQLKSSINKDELLNKLNMALIDDETKVELKSIIQKNVSFPAFIKPFPQSLIGETEIRQ